MESRKITNISMPIHGLSAGAILLLRQLPLRFYMIMHTIPPLESFTIFCIVSCSFI